MIIDYAHFLENKLNNRDKAEEYFKEAVELSPTASTNFALAKFLSQGGRYEESMPYFEEAVAKKEGNCIYYYEFGYALYKLEKYDRSYEMYNKAFAADKKTHGVDKNGNTKSMPKGTIKVFNQLEDIMARKAAQSQQQQQQQQTQKQKQREEKQQGQQGQQDEQKGGNTSENATHKNEVGNDDKKKNDHMDENNQHKKNNQNGERNNKTSQNKKHKNANGERDENKNNSNNNNNNNRNKNLVGRNANGNVNIPQNTLLEESCYDMTPPLPLGNISKVGNGNGNNISKSSKTNDYLFPLEEYSFQFQGDSVSPGLSFTGMDPFCMGDMTNLCIDDMEPMAETPPPLPQEQLQQIPSQPASQAASQVPSQTRSMEVSASQTVGPKISKIESVASHFSEPTFFVCNNNNDNSNNNSRNGKLSGGSGSGSSDRNGDKSDSKQHTSDENEENDKIENEDENDNKNSQPASDNNSMKINRKSGNNGYNSNNSNSTNSNITNSNINSNTNSNTNSNSNTTSNTNSNTNSNSDNTGMLSSNRDSTSGNNSKNGNSSDGNNNGNNGNNNGGGNNNNVNNNGGNGNNNNNNNGSNNNNNNGKNSDVEKKSIVQIEFDRFWHNLACLHQSKHRYYQKFVALEINFISTIKILDEEMLTKEIGMNKIHCGLFLESVEKWKSENERFKNWLKKLQLFDEYHNKLKVAGLCTFDGLYYNICDREQLVEILKDRVNAEYVCLDVDTMWENTPRFKRLHRRKMLRMHHKNSKNKLGGKNSKSGKSSKNVHTSANISANINANISASQSVNQNVNHRSGGVISNISNGSSSTSGLNPSMSDGINTNSNSGTNSNTTLTSNSGQIDSSMDSTVNTKQSDKSLNDIRDLSHGGINIQTMRDINDSHDNSAASDETKHGSGSSEDVQDNNGRK